MKKTWAIIGLLVLGLLPKIGWAKDNKEVHKPNWEVVAENKEGIYSYDKNSLVYFPDSAKPQDIKEIKVTAKADILEENFLRLLQEKYGKKLKDQDKVANCILHLVLNQPKKTYNITSVELLSKAGKELSKKSLPEKFQPIPPKTFVAVLLEETTKTLQTQVKGEKNATTRLSENKQIPKK